MSKSQYFDGDVKFSFVVNKVVPGLHIDFNCNGGKIHKYLINGVEVTEDLSTIWNDTHLLMLTKYLKEGENSVHITYTR